MLATLLFAAEVAEEEVSKAPFYISAGVLVGFAALLSGVGIARHATFPPSRGVANGLILVTLILVAVTAYTSVITG
jgi:Na+/pantothenate symporter